MICISKLTQDINGSILFEEAADSKTSVYRARVRKTATLDGGVFIDHQGYAPGDNTIEISARVTEAQETALVSILQNETFVNISTRGGFFKGVISSLRAFNGEIKMTFEIKEVA
jgi:hypothetical protein